MMNSVWLLAQNDGDGGGVAGLIGGLVGLVVGLLFAIVVIAGAWKTFEKAGKPGWAVIVPIYNIIVMLEIAGKPLWWVILLMIPCVQFVVGIIVAIAFAKAFGKSEIFGLGLAFLGFIFFPILGFGDAKYIGAPRE